MALGVLRIGGLKVGHDSADVVRPARVVGSLDQRLACRLGAGGVDQAIAHAILLDVTWPTFDVLEEHYRFDGAPIEDPDVFHPVSGVPHRPEYAYRRR